MFVFRHALAVIAGKLSLALLCLALQPVGAQSTYRVVEIGALTHSLGRMFFGGLCLD